MAVPIVQEEEEILPGMLLEPIRGQIRYRGVRDGMVECRCPKLRPFRFLEHLADREVVIETEAPVESVAVIQRRPRDKRRGHISALGQALRQRRNAFAQSDAEVLHLVDAGIKRGEHAHVRRHRPGGGRGQILKRTPSLASWSRWGEVPRS